MLEIYILKAFDFYRQEYYSSKFLNYEDAERTARFLMQSKDVFAVKIGKNAKVKKWEKK